MFAVGRFFLLIAIKPFLTALQFLPLRPARADGGGRTRLTVQGHARRGLRLDLHVVRLVAAHLHTTRPLPPSARRTLPFRHSVYCNTHDSIPFLSC